MFSFQSSFVGKYFHKGIRIDEYFSNILYLEVISLKRPGFLGNGLLGCFISVF